MDKLPTGLSGYLDRKIGLISAFVHEERLDVDLAEVLFRDVQRAFDMARDLRAKRVGSFRSRCGMLLRILPILRKRLADLPLERSIRILEELQGLEDVLLDQARSKPSKRA